MKNNNVEELSSNVIILQLSINDASIATERQIIGLQIKLPHYMLFVRNFKYNIGRLKVKGWKEIYHERVNEARSGHVSIS
jgi:hypothetical protein